MAWGRLALLQAADDEQARDKLADLFGYVRLPDDGVEKQLQDESGRTSGQIIGTAVAADIAPQRPPARFLRLNKFVRSETDRNDLQKPSYLSDPSMRLRASDAPPGTYRFAAPLPLMPIARLLPPLFNGLAQAKSGQGIDHRLLLRRIAQGKALQRLPKRQRRRWPQRLQIIVDVDRRLEPYWSDFEAIVRQLQQLLGQEAVEALRFDDDAFDGETGYCLPWPTRDHDRWRRWQTPPPDVAVLILSDFGIGDNRSEIVWQRRLARLQQHPGPRLTLSPAVRSPADKRFCEAFRPNPLNDAFPLPRHPLRAGFTLGEASPEAIDDVLTWLSALPLIDAGLLRRLRVELQWGDSALEAAIWNHPQMRDVGLGICLQQPVSQHYQQRFQKDHAGSAASTRFWRIVESHHAEAYQGLRQLEKFKQCVFEQQDEAAMRDYFQRLCATGMQSGGDPAQQRALRLQCRTVLAALPQSIWNSALQVLAYPLYAAAYEDEIRAGQWPEQLPAGFDPERLQWVNPAAAEEKQRWRIVQTGDLGQLKCEPHTPENEVSRPVAEFEAAKGFPPRLTLTAAGESFTRTQPSGLAFTLPENGKAIIEAGASTLELDAIRRPSWAGRIRRDADGLWAGITWLNQQIDVFWQVSNTDADGYWRWPAPFGEDRYGLYADLRVKSVIQRFRWIEPGAFWMGSPEDEPERWDDETLHFVTLTQGFWLADTTVTQALWQTIMGDNPSRFKDSPDHPVEQVGWQDAQVFIDKLNGLCSGLAAKLPSEAQWEYACRAATSTPFSFGVNITPEQVNYDGNRPYANGDKGFYRRKTVPVKSLPANPWGLYEMHGNVWEWCADAWRQGLSAAPATDPLITEADDGDSARVVRGGSWYYFGRSVRSAVRPGVRPDSRNYYLGFRLALGHAELRPGQDNGIKGQEAAAGEPASALTAGLKKWVGKWRNKKQ